ncbi:MAG: TRAP transporter large permease [Kiritimatiellia bacterium]
MSPIEIGILGCVALFLLLLSSMPVAFVMLLVGTVGFAVVVSPQAALTMVCSDVFNTISSHSLTVIPLFVFMGQVAFHAGISKRLFNAAYNWLGWLPGGLAMATVGACAGFGAICGSGPATAATMSAVALPEMKRYRYNMELATGTVAAGGTLGMLIPPSVVFIVYGVMTEQSIGKLFMAGVVPGLLIAVLFCVMIWWQCRRRPSLGPAAQGITWSARWRSLSGVIETLLLFALVIGGMFAGWFTPTEAAAVGAAGSLLIAVVRRQLSRQALVRALMETARTSCMVMIIVAGAVIFGRFLAVTRIHFELATWLTALAAPPWMVVALIVLFYLVCGCFIDALGLVMLTIPIFYPVIQSLNYDLIWFGVLIVVVTQMGVISPPVGVNVYVVSGMERDVALHTVFKGALPFLACLILAAALLVAFPQLSLWLPSLM